VTGSHSVGSNAGDRKAVQGFLRRPGEDIANELVDWFNAVDLTYRADLRELNELNFARFDAKLEQRVAELRSEIHALRADLLRWMFGFWISTVLTLGGLMVALRDL
jgi:hypothetical protein